MNHSIHGASSKLPHVFPLGRDLRTVIQVVLLQRPPRKYDRITSKIYLTSGGDVVENLCDIPRQCRRYSTFHNSLTNSFSLLDVRTILVTNHALRAKQPSQEHVPACKISPLHSMNWNINVFSVRRQLSVAKAPKIGVSAAIIKGLM